jgi:hypothetical protein
MSIEAGLRRESEMDDIPYRGHKIQLVWVGPRIVAHVRDGAGVALTLRPQPDGTDRTSALNEAMRAIDQSMS